MYAISDRWRRTFGLGEDEKHISTVDEEGVAIASIKALQAEVTAKDHELTQLDAKYTLIERRLELLEKKSDKAQTRGSS